MLPLCIVDEEWQDEVSLVGYVNCEVIYPPNPPRQTPE